jgi:4-hydroxy 2-oxovalerate aldolase
MAEREDRSMGVEILDCTLRDGGYYCNWDFEDDTVKRYLDAVAHAGVSIVEIGFRSKPAVGFAGKFKFSTDGMLERLFENSPMREEFGKRKMRLAVMIDGKDFIKPTGEIDRHNLDDRFKDKSTSPVDMVRVTTTKATLDPVLQIGKWLRDRGYEVSINVMQASLLSEKDLAEIAQALERSGMDCMVVADSFGGLTPEETRSRFLAIKQHFTRCAGFHGHDNLGLALSNSLAAIEGGAGMVDCALHGMGRGAGNLRTEQFLLYLRLKRERRDVDPAPLFEVASTDFARLHEQYRWGTSLPYMLSGVYNTHPMYAQQLLQTGRYSPLEIVRVLEVLHESGDNTSFSNRQLSSFLPERFAHIQDKVSARQRYPKTFPPLTFNPDRSKEVLVLGSGASVRKRAPDIQEFIRKYKPVVIECNVQKEIEPSDNHEYSLYSLFTNYQRLEKHLPNLTTTKRRCVVLGMDVVGGEMARVLDGMEVYHYPYRVEEGKFEYTQEGCVIPSDVVAMFAFALAMQSGASILYLCGFDGYLPEPGHAGDAPATEKTAMEREMENFFHLKENLDVGKTSEDKVRVISLTPTVYPIAQESLYAYL